MMVICTCCPVLSIESAIRGVPIAKTRNFFESVGVPTRLSDHGIGRETIPVIVERLEKRGQVALGEQQDVNPQVVEEILQLCGELGFHNFVLV